MKPTEILPRFAACAERLKGTGAPRLPSVPGFPSLSIQTYLQSGLYEPDACRDKHLVYACVYWAMKVAEWYCETRGLDLTVRKIRTKAWSVSWDSRFISGRHKGGKGVEETWCCGLESICDAIGETNA